MSQQDASIPEDQSELEVSHAATQVDASPRLPESQVNLPDSDRTLQVRRVTVTNAEGSDLPASNLGVDAYVGLIIDGRYQIEHLIAQGGMGVVYRARHRIIDKPVAVKILRSELATNREVTQRFLTEAQAASAIGSEHIVDVTDYGELPDGATYLVMEFLDGESLGERIDRSEQPLALSEILAIARQLTEGLARAHDAQIVHRDLKPDNVALVHRSKQDIFVKILDFGIAKVVSSQNQITRAGRVFGTPHYMSPEQAAGTPIDHRTDIYSLGAMLFQMASLQLPFDADNPLAILTQHMSKPAPALGEICDVPVDFEAVVGKCLSKRPEERYASMHELELDLERIEQGVPSVAALELVKRPDTPLQLRKRLKKRLGRTQKQEVAWSLAAAAIIGVSLTWFTIGSNSAPPAPPAPPPPTALTTAPSPPKVSTVALVLSPWDAHVFRGNEDLGMMPLTVEVLEGSEVTLEVRRVGYHPRQIRLNSDEGRRVVQLSPLVPPQSQFAGPDAGLLDELEFPSDAGLAPEVASSSAAQASEPTLAAATASPAAVTSARPPANTSAPGATAIPAPVPTTTQRPPPVSPPAVPRPQLPPVALRPPPGPPPMVESSEPDPGLFDKPGPVPAPGE